MAVFVYGMIGYTLRESLTNRTNAWETEIKLVGLTNYRELLVDPEFTHALSNLLKFTVVFMIGCLLSGLIMSLLLEKGIKGEGFFRSTYLYPMAISFIAMGTSWRWLMDSARDADATGLNYLLQKIGLGFLQSDWYTSEAGSMYAMALPAIWQMAGYVMALFLAGFRGIPDDLREAARVDGATEFKIYRHILFPQLSPTFLTILIILGHISMKVFDLIFGIASKSYVTKVLAIYMWQVIFDFQNFAAGAAIAIVILVMIAVAVIPYLIYVNKTEEANK
ncbi:MAG: ABC transporter permease subunit [Actinobacteria bacterium]|nr:ABC transporter permease subunit [Actinomycetota bacterium]MSV70716.1 ABC transporter permease subunit [Actinomycetota bacterium]MSW13216.1 ABC transporter permease subunit [Actinomycetota bacterium]MSX46740.1 ABC transporter permease subunit [Actinomycetota bacterium]MSX90903.1 ABC transporter permease subunit [Actinomycetota bacterium]